MSIDDIDTDTAPARDAPIRVTLDLPPGLARELRFLVTAGLYLSLDEAVRHALVTAWRFERGSYHRLRLDLRSDEAADEADEEPADQDAPSTNKG